MLITVKNTVLYILILQGDIKGDVVLFDIILYMPAPRQNCMWPVVVINYTPYASPPSEGLMRYWHLMFEYFKKIIESVLMTRCRMFERCNCVTIGYCLPISFQNMFAIYDELKIQSFA